MNKMRFFFVSFYIVFFSLQGKAQFVRPESYFTFDETNPVKSSIGNKHLDTAYYQCPFINRPSPVIKGADFSSRSCIAVSNIFSATRPRAAAVEFLFKGKGLQFLSFPRQAFSITINESAISFVTTSNNNKRQVLDDMTIPYTGKGKNSFYYISDGNWHHFVFAVDLVSGKKEIWLDGELLPEFCKRIPKADFLEFGDMDGFKGLEYLDEVAFYTQPLPGKEISQHYAEFTNGRHYSFTEANIKAKPVAKAETMAPVEINGGYDVKEFAPGYPEYTVQALEQLRSFPLPRYKTGVPMFRNFSWADINYLHRELTGKGGKGFGKSDPQKAVLLEEEMAKNWNYYLDIPCLRTDAKTSDKRYGSINTLEGALIQYANSHPELPLATIILQGQNHPEDIGIRHQGAFVSSQDLPDNYYLRDKNGKVILSNNRKWLSPLMPLDIIKRDAQVSRFYLSQLTKYLKRPIDIINENGEVFGNIRPEELWNLDPEVSKHKRKSGLNNYRYNGYFQNLLDSTYKAEILSLPALKNTRFTFYNSSAVQAAYWPDYATRRNLNTPFNNMQYPTPDFYPSYPDNWRNARGSLNGYGTISQGRKIEISLGDKLFSPFVSAGWDTEEKNIRPAQWLALLKSMVMLGADFFYTGYFNVTGPNGEWPNGKGPNDPRGYIYQVAMPAYAQAIASYVRPFFTDGELLNPAAPSDIERQFRFTGNNDNELILVRKYKGKYLIYGSIQPVSNIAGAVPAEVITQITLDNKEIKFRIRRQGSMYVYDPTGTRPVFYQLDAWHQYEHPAFWKNEIALEAELAEKYPLSELITEKKSDQTGDFSEFTTGVRLKGTDKALKEIHWSFIPRYSTISYCQIVIRSTGKPSSFRIGLNNISLDPISIPEKSGWSTIKVPISNCWAMQINNLGIEVVTGEVIIDKIILVSSQK